MNNFFMMPPKIEVKDTVPNRKMRVRNNKTVSHRHGRKLAIKPVAYHQPTVCNLATNRCAAPFRASQDYFKLLKTESVPSPFPYSYEIIMDSPKILYRELP